MADGASKINIAKAYIEVIPSLEGAQKTIASEMGAVAAPAAKEAGEKSGKSFGESLAKGLKTTSAVIAGAMAVATGAAVAASKSFINAAKDTANYGDEVDKTAQKLGLSNKSYQEWDYVMKICGTEMSSMTTGLKTLTNKLDDAKNGSEGAQEMFSRLGISMEDIQSMSREELFEKTIAGLQGMADSTDRAALANDLFGKSGQNLAPLFNMTAEETQELIKKANDLGMVMSDEGVKSSARYKDSLTTLQGTMTGIKNNIMTQFMPGLAKATEGLADALGGKGTGKLTDGVNLLMAELKRVAPVAIKLVSDIGISLIQSLGPLLPDLVNTIFTLLISAITTITSMIPQMMPSIISGIEGIMSAIFECLPIITSSLFQLITDLVTWLSDTKNIETFVNGIVDLAAQIAEQMGTLLPVLIPAIVKIVGALANNLMSPRNVSTIIYAVGQVIAAIFVTLVNMVPELIDFAVGVYNNMKEYFLQFGGQFLTSLGQWVASVLVKIGSFVKDIVNKVKGLPSELTTIGKNLVTGLWNGISDKMSWVTNKIKGMGSSITSAIKKVFGIHSPSKVWRQQIGQNLGLSIGLGFADVMDDVKTDMAAEMNGLTGNMTANVTAYGSTDPLSSGQVTTYNGGNITLNVYGAEGQNVDELVNKVAYKLEELTRRQEMLWS